MAINGRLKELKQNAGLSDRHIANAIGLTRTLVNKHMIGVRKISLEHLVKYADLFNVSTDYLLGRTEFKSISLDDEAYLEADNVLGDLCEILGDLEAFGYDLGHKANFLGNKFFKLQNEMLERKHAKGANYGDYENPVC